MNILGIIHIDGCMDHIDIIQDVTFIMEIDITEIDLLDVTKIGKNGKIVKEVLKEVPEEVQKKVLKEVPEEAKALEQALNAVVDHQEVLVQE
jgi:hypothetical protein